MTLDDAAAVWIVHSGLDRARHHEAHGTLDKFIAWIRSGAGGCRTDGLAWWTRGDRVSFWFGESIQFDSPPDAVWTIRELVHAALHPSSVVQLDLFAERPAS